MRAMAGLLALIMRRDAVQTRLGAREFRGTVATLKDRVARAFDPGGHRACLFRTLGNGLLRAAVEASS